MNVKVSDFRDLNMPKDVDLSCGFCYDCLKMDILDFLETIQNTNLASFDARERIVDDVIKIIKKKESEKQNEMQRMQ